MNVRRDYCTEQTVQSSSPNSSTEWVVNMLKEYLPIQILTNDWEH